MGNKKLNYLVSPKLKEALTIEKDLKDQNYECRLVGGVVRDLCMGIEPKDVDLATTALPQEVEEILTQKGWKTIPTGKSHGTISVVGKLGIYEVTTLREDIYTDGRHAKVLFCKDFLKDAARRDFTINAMFLDSQGVLYDPFGGFEDLQKKSLTFVGNPHRRIKEDYLRILRAYRFLARLKFAISSKDEQAMEEEREGIRQLSRERIFKEMEEIFQNPQGWMGIQGLLRIKAWEILFPKTTNQANFLAKPEIWEELLPVLRWVYLFFHLDEVPWVLWRLPKKIKKFFFMVKKTMEVLETIQGETYEIFIWMQIWQKEFLGHEEIFFKNLSFFSKNLKLEQAKNIYLEKKSILEKSIKIPKGVSKEVWIQHIKDLCHGSSSSGSSL